MVDDSIRYPDTDCCLVTYTGGTAGALIMTLLTCFLFKKESYVDNVLPSDRGNFHSVIDIVEQLWNEESKEHWYHERFAKNNKDINVYDYVTPANADQPLILHQHEHVSNYDRLRFVYPKFLEFIILSRAEDGRQVNLNLFLKLIADTPYRNHDQHEESFKEQWRNYRDDWLNTNPKELWINEYDSARDLVDNKNDFERFALLNDNWIHSVDYKCTVDAEMQNIIKIAGDCSSRITFLDFHDIHHNPKKILDQISQALKLPIPEIAKLKYDEWLDKQTLVEHLVGK